MTTDYGKSLVRFDSATSPSTTARSFALAKKKIDRTFRDYIAEGIEDGSIRPCDAKLSAFAIAGSLNWIGHWYQPNGALEAEAIAGEFAIRLTEGLAIKPTRKKADKPPARKRKSRGGSTMNVTHGLRRALQINPNGLAIVCRRSAEELARGRRPRGAACRRHPRARRATPATASRSCRSIPTAISNSISPPAGPAP